MKVLSNRFFIRTVGAVMAAMQIMSGFGSPLVVSASEEENVAEEKIWTDDLGGSDIAFATNQSGKASGIKITDKNFKSSKADIRIRVNKKYIKNKGLKVKAKKNKKNVNVVYVPAKALTKAVGWKYVARKNEVYISTGSRRAVFNTRRDGYSFVTEIKGACGHTAPIQYGKPYMRNKVLYIPLSVFENLSDKYKVTKDLKKNVVTFSKRK